MKVVIACVLGVAGVLALRSVVHDSFRQAVATATKDRAADCLSLAGSTTREYQGYAYIVGSVRNRCETKFSQVTISFKLDSGSVADAVIVAYARDVRAGETRQFRSAYRIDKKSTFRFDRITAF